MRAPPELQVQSDAGDTDEEDENTEPTPRRKIVHYNPHVFETVTWSDAIGRGVQGRVMQCRDARGKQMAMKTSKLHDTQFSTEVNILLSLPHSETIVKVLSAIDVEAEGYVLMPLAHGNLTLMGTPGEVPDLDLSVLAWPKIFDQVLAGLSFLKRQLVIHRDIKAENLLLYPETNSKPNAVGRVAVNVRISDFGLAKQLYGSDQHCRTQLGTWLYMSPPRMRGDAYSFEADVWSVGILIAQAVQHRLMAISSECVPTPDMFERVPCMDAARYAIGERAHRPTQMQECYQSMHATHIALIAYVTEYICDGLQNLQEACTDPTGRRLLTKAIDECLFPRPTLKRRRST